VNPIRSKTLGNIFLLKNPFDLTDEQWQVVHPLIPPPSPAAGRGRPLIDERAVLNGILWKIRANASWYDMPSRYPSWQTCYRRYHQWQRSGLLNSILAAIFLDLNKRGGLNPQRAFIDGTFAINRVGSGYQFLIDSRWQDTWQLSTAMILVSMGIKRAFHASDKVLK
jgi:hypothetical protein